jgi:DNA-binding NarL/FixJ family response regulator
MKKIRLLLIEDNRLIREGIRAIIQKEPDLKLVAASANLAKAPLPGKQKPQVVLLDQCLRDQNTLQLIEMVKKKCPQTKVVVMGLLPVTADVAEFVKAGASGFILKDSSVKDFLKTIRSVAGGGSILPSRLTGSLFSQIAEDAARNGKIKVSDVRLTKRQREIVDLIGEGIGNKEIAQRLHLATYTVKSHVHAILEKFALRSRVQVAIYANAQNSSKTTGGKIARKE